MMTLYTHTVEPHVCHHDYVPVQGTDQCKLFCRVHRSSAYYLLASSVIDGTECGAGTFHKCVNGQCVPAGCDHVLGSGKALGTYVLQYLH